jgi:hypothetical protein
MPELNKFPTSMMHFVTKALIASGDSLRESAQFGADYMRDYIREGSSTGTQWHATKNDLNGYRTGSRIGGKIFSQAGKMIFQPSGHSGQMLDSIEVGQLRSGSEAISINYGWITNRQEYFLMQDTGSYAMTAKGKPTGMGMGLINTSEGGGKGTLQKLGAYNATNKFFIEQMKSKGFKVTGGGAND